jgi:D-3-phosphoglycerate dehydrogenase
MVSAPVVARERGIHIAETRKDAQGAFGSYVRLIVTTEAMTRSVAGTIYSDGKPRFIQIKGINLEAEPMRFMLYTTNTDTPGYIGALGTKLGDLGVNIATFALGRAEKSGEAIALLGVDEAIAPSALAEIARLPQIRQAKALSF